MAVDPRYYAYGMPIFIDTKVPASPGDWRGEPYQSLVIAQDTGGAIKGQIRGDLFFGWGSDAGGRAASMNHPVDMIILLPKQLANRLGSVQESWQDD
jgi:membrane-bound lytic murein transglycosylase A